MQKIFMDLPRLICLQLSPTTILALSSGGGHIDFMSAGGQRWHIKTTRGFVVLCG